MNRQIENKVAELLYKYHLFLERKMDIEFEDESEKIIKEFINDKKNLIKKNLKETQDNPKIKKARTAYNFFCQDMRPIIKIELEEECIPQTNAEIMRQLGKRWKELEEDEKEEWIQLAEEDKKRFN